MQDDLDKKAATALRDIRIRLGRSQEDVSIEIDLDQSTLSKVERLGPAHVGWKRFCEIVKALGYEAEIVFHPVHKEPGASGRSEETRSTQGGTPGTQT